MSDAWQSNWRSMLLQARIRELSDAEYKYSTRAATLGLLHDPALDYSATAELRKAAIRGFEAGDLKLCERLSAAAEFKSKVHAQHLSRKPLHHD